MKKLLTISVAAYNVEDFLDNALASIANLGDSRLEVIVVNDGSSDGTSCIAHEFEMQYPNIFRCIDKENGGYGSTINASLERATGKYYRLLDGDDWYDAAELTGFLDLLENINVDLIVSPFVKQMEGSGKAETVEPLLNFPLGELDSSQIPYSCLVRMHGATFSTELLKAANHRITENCYYTDTEFMALSLSHVSSVYHDNHPVYQYRVGRDGQSMSADGILKHYLDHEIVTIKLIDSVENCRLSLSQDALSRLRYWAVHEIALHYIYIYLIEDEEALKEALSCFNNKMIKLTGLLSEATRLSKSAKLGTINNRLLNRVGHKLACQKYQ